MTPIFSRTFRARAALAIFMLALAACSGPLVPAAPPTATPDAAIATATMAPTATLVPTAPVIATASAAATATAVATSVPVPNLNAGGLSGGYMADYRPNWMSYLVLAQSGQTLAGYALTAEPDNKGGTKATNTPVQGQVDGDAITLWMNVTLVGRKEGDRLVFTSPSATGRLDTLTYARATQDAYNAALAGWQRDLLTAFQGVQAAQTVTTRSQQQAQAAADRVQQQASALVKQIVNVRGWTSQISNHVGRMKDQLAEEQSALKDMQTKLGDLKQKSAVRPMTQYQACSTVSYAYNSSLSYSYNSTLDYHRKALANAANDLTQALDAIDARVAATRAASQSLQNALAAAPGFRGQLEARPGDEADPLTGYQTAAAGARKSLAYYQGQDAANVQTADGIMADGKNSLDSALALVSCS